MNLHRLLSCQTYLSACEEMICLETQYFSVNRILLLVIGLWPYERSLIVQFQLISFLGTLTTFIIFQVR